GAAALRVAGQRPRTAERRRAGDHLERRGNAANRATTASGEGGGGQPDARGRRALPHSAGPRAGRMADSWDRGRGGGARTAPDHPRSTDDEARHPAPVLTSQISEAPPTFRRRGVYSRPVPLPGDRKVLCMGKLRGDACASGGAPHPAATPPP